jgi:hypothetical protein
MIVFLILPLLLIIFYQDFKFRHFWTIIYLLLISISVVNLIFFNINFLKYTYFIFNICFIAITYSGVWLYFILKHRGYINIINTQIGIGDVLFFIPVCMYFSPFNFILYFLFVLGSSLIYFLLSIFMGQEKQLIPLAGIASLSLFVILTISRLLHIPLDQDIISLKF